MTRLWEYSVSSYNGKFILMTDWLTNEYSILMFRCLFLSWQKKLSAYSKMQESMTVPTHCSQGRQVQKHAAQREEVPEADDTGLQGKEVQPAEAEYLSSRCVVFTYFQGSIGDVVDEHFSRALSQPSAFTGDAKPTRISAGPLWKGEFRVIVKAMPNQTSF